MCVCVGGGGYIYDQLQKGVSRSQRTEGWGDDLLRGRCAACGLGCVLGGTGRLATGKGNVAWVLTTATQRCNA